VSAPSLKQLRDKANLATLREAAEILGVPEDRLRYRVRMGGLRGVRAHGARRCYDLSDLEAMADQPHEAVLLYRDGHGVRAIARRLNIQVASVRRALNRAGITTRPTTSRQAAQKRLKRLRSKGVELPPARRSREARSPRAAD
jgi:DNA-binding transcriptional MerR regulator